MLLAGTLPDEFCHGYTGRLGAINLQPNHISIIRELRCYFNQHDAPEAFLLASASGISIQQFVKQHTLLPLMRAVTRTHPNIANGDPSNPTIIEWFTKRKIKSKAFLCPACVEEDSRLTGFSYWRRPHQLPGVDWCLIHRTPLHYATSKDAFYDTPNYTLELSKPVIYDNSILENPVVQRYVEIATGWLKLDHPHSVQEATLKITSKAKEVGLRMHLNGKQSILSKEALGLLPEAWLRSHFPGINTDGWSQFDRINPLANTISMSMLRALSLAIMFNTADAALAYWTAPHQEHPEQL